MGVVLREVWIEAQAAAMGERITLREALERIRGVEEERLYEDDD
jgi:hypothetical protein